MLLLVMSKTFNYISNKKEKKIRQEDKGKEKKNYGRKLCISY